MKGDTKRDEIIKTLKEREADLRAHGVRHAAPFGSVSRDERSERATRLRQSRTFCGILTEAERRAIYESYSTRTYHPRGESNFG